MVKYCEEMSRGPHGDTRDREIDTFYVKQEVTFELCLQGRAEVLLAWNGDKNVSLREAVEVKPHSN